MFQCSSASRKFLNRHLGPREIRERSRFSALQRAENSSINPDRSGGPVSTSFSALQRAENSSISAGFIGLRCSPVFQCSSASRKFLNICPCRCWLTRRSMFQCSSASRKFLNRIRRDADHAVCRFQCSSASRKFLNRSSNTRAIPARSVSVLFSEPKIPQLVDRRRRRR